jgi:NAD(P)H dehydrogenase (quinone)
MSAELAVTGATGRLGGHVARLLSDAGVVQRLVVRDPARAPRLPGASAVQASYRDGAAAEKALAGCRVLFMVSGEEAEDRVRQHLTFIDAAAAAGVRHVVYTSFFGAAPDAVFTLARDHWSTEEHIRKSGMEFTFLRNNFYMDVFPEFVGSDGTLRGPAGTGRVAAVAREDAGRAAAVVLQQPGEHAGKTYRLTGPSAFTLAEAAEAISSETGQTVRFVDETVEEAYASRAPYAAPQWQLDAWVSTYTSIARGEVAEVTNDVERITEMVPLSFAHFLYAAEQRRRSTGSA